METSPGVLIKLKMRRKNWSVRFLVQAGDEGRQHGAHLAGAGTWVEFPALKRGREKRKGEKKIFSVSNGKRSFQTLPSAFFLHILAISLLL